MTHTGPKLGFEVMTFWCYHCSKIFRGHLDHCLNCLKVLFIYLFICKIPHIVIFTLWNSTGQSQQHKQWLKSCKWNDTRRVKLYLTECSRKLILRCVVTVSADYLASYYEKKLMSKKKIFSERVSELLSGRRYHPSRYYNTWHNTVEFKNSIIFIFTFQFLYVFNTAG